MKIAEASPATIRIRDILHSQIEHLVTTTSCARNHRMYDATVTARIGFTRAACSATAARPDGTSSATARLHRNSAAIRLDGLYKDQLELERLVSVPLKCFGIEFRRRTGHDATPEITAAGLKSIERYSPLKRRTGATCSSTPTRGEIRHTALRN